MERVQHVVSGESSERSITLVPTVSCSSAGWTGAREGRAEAERVAENSGDREMVGPVSSDRYFGPLQPLRPDRLLALHVARSNVHDLSRVAGYCALGPIRPG